MSGSRFSAWPLAVLVLGFPIWWLLGMGELIFFLVAIPMVFQLLRRRPLLVPFRFGFWLAFLVVVVISGLLLSTHAPGSLNDPVTNRALTFTFRFALYAVATIFMLYAINMSESELPTRRVADLLAWFFVITVAGGLFGLVAPTFSITSLVQQVLPHSLATNQFMFYLVHPSTADIQTVLGYARPRPKAPFAFANSWGANFTITLPFFLWRWWGGSGHSRVRRLLAIPILIGGAVGVVNSLNRMLWVGIVLAALIYGLNQVRTRGLRILPAVAAVATVGILAVALSPLGGLIQQRINSPQSNARRGSLAGATIASVSQASPVLGFGDTRKVAGNFFSIAGGATPGCPACQVPPFGTQGHVWLVIFAQGALGLILFYAFLVGGLTLHWRRRDAIAVACLAAMVPLLVETLVYDTLGSPFIMAFLVLGLLCRSRADSCSVTLSDYFTTLRSHWRVVAIGAALGLGGGVLVLATRTPVVSSTAQVLVPDNPMFLPTSVLFKPRSVTLDTEAALAMAQPRLDSVRRQARAPGAAFSISALPTSQVLLLTVTGRDSRAVARAANDWAAQVVQDQRAQLRDLRTTRLALLGQVATRIRQRHAQAGPGADAAYGALLMTNQALRDRVNQTILFNATQIVTARPGRLHVPNRAVAPVSGLALGLVLGSAGAFWRPRRVGSKLYAPDGALLLRRSSGSAGALVRRQIDDRHGASAGVGLVAISTRRRGLRWARQVLDRAGFEPGDPGTAGRSLDDQLSHAVSQDAVVLVMGPTAPARSVRRTLEVLDAVGKSPDVIIADVTRPLGRGSFPQRRNSHRRVEEELWS
ncbi:MAG: hypothetical protein M3Z50_00555 [Actinomycetota bacterium]|nr:hypothetical protein [Actinomycetota bacterium]